MNLAPRKGFIHVTGTSSNVGPNTYNVTYPCCDYRKENYAPFLSTAPRTKKIKPTVDVTCDIPQTRSKIKYGNSLQFTAPRKTIAVDSNLQPNELAGIKQQQVKLKPSRKLVGGGKLYLCHMPFTSGVSPPSIPTRIDENGYLVTGDNDLIKRPPNEHDNTLGPAYYDVPMGELCYNTFKYKGCTWSKMMGKRSKLVNDIGPGPAVYNPKMARCVRYKPDENKFKLTRKCCEVPRFTCEKICHAKMENLPGPGYYEIVDIDKIGKVKNLSLGPRPFINAAKRFTYQNNQTPGPQHYLVCDCYKHRRDFSFKDVAFCIEAQRFCKQKYSYDAGPASYSHAEPKYHRYSENLMKAPFGITQARNPTLLMNVENPGPNEYVVSNIHCCPNEPSQNTSVFKSNVRRFKSECQVGPDPTSYSIVPVGQQSHAKVKVPFNISQKRSAKSCDFAGRIAGEGSPGVGEYNLNPDDLSSTGWHFNISPRFKRRSLTKIPGPGHYSFHPIVSDAMYKSKITHNARLQKEVENKLRCHTKINELVKNNTKSPAPDRKHLRWFETGTGVFKGAL